MKRKATDSERRLKPSDNSPTVHKRNWRHGSTEKTKRRFGVGGRRGDSGDSVVAGFGQQRDEGVSVGAGASDRGADGAVGQDVSDERLCDVHRLSEAGRGGSSSEHRDIDRFRACFPCRRGGPFYGPVAASSALRRHSEVHRLRGLRGGVSDRSGPMSSTRGWMSGRRSIGPIRKPFPIHSW